MASPPLVLPGVLFVGEDERARVVAHLGPSAGWFVPAGIERWSHEVSVVPRDTLTEDIRRQTKLVMPEEQIPPAKMPLTLQAAMKSPLVAVTSRLAPKLVELGVRVHTVGVDRVTSSFYYLAEGGGEDAVRVEGDLVASVGAMLGERADNAAIERVLDGLVDRLLRSLSHDRVTELSIELAAALPRAAADGTGAQDVELEEFEKALAALLGSSEKFSALAQDIAGKLAESHERKLDVALFGEAKKTSMGPFDLMVGERKVALATYERWVMSGQLDESKSKPLPDVAAQADVAAAAAAKAKADANAAAAKLKADAAAAKAKADADVAEARAKAERAKADDAALKAKAEAEAQAELAVQAELAAQAKADADAKARAAEQEAAAAKAKAEAAAKASEDAKKASDSKPDAKAAEAKRDAAKAKAATAKSSDPKPKAFDQKAVARAAETKPVVAAKSSMTTILLVIVAFVIGFVVIKMFFLK